MQKNVPKYTPDFVRTRARSGPRRRSARCPTRSATTAARCCGSPTSAPSSTTRRSCRADRPDRVTHLVLDLDPPEGDGVRRWRCAVAHLVRQALDDVGLAGGGQDQRGQGRARLRPDRRPTRPIEDAAAATRAIAARAEALDPSIATTAFIEGRTAKARCSSTRPASAARPSSRPTARACGPALPVSFPVRWDDLDDVVAGRLHGAHRARAARRSRSVGGDDAGPAAAAAPTSSRRAATIPVRTGAGDARRQAPQARPRARRQ